jgi:RNA polymerase sigma factor (sigma-70 family)
MNTLSENHAREQTSNVVAIDAGDHRKRFEESRNSLVEAHRSLVLDIALEIYQEGVKPCFHIDDLVSAGNQGLMEAATRAVSTRTDAEFRSFARRRITGAMRNIMRRKELLEATRPGLDAAPEPRMAPVIETEIDHGRLMKRLGGAISELPERERTILTRYYYGPDEPTLATIGVEVGLSDRRVKQLHDRGIGKLQMRLKKEAV